MKNKRLEVRLSPAQYQALVEYAEAHDIAAVTDVVRKAIMELIPEWPDDLIPRGKYPRQKKEVQDGDHAAPGSVPGSTGR